MNKRLGWLLYFVSLLVFIAMVGGASFAVWVPIDILVVIICSLISYHKKIKLLSYVAWAIVVGFILHFTFPLWILIDLASIYICFYAGNKFIKDDIRQLQNIE